MTRYHDGNAMHMKVCSLVRARKLKVASTLSYKYPSQC
jgi:hypothetical protein